MWITSRGPCHPGIIPCCISVGIYGDATSPSTVGISSAPCSWNCLFFFSNWTHIVLLVVQSNITLHFATRQCLLYLMYFCTNRNHTVYYAEAWVMSTAVTFSIHHEVQNLPSVNLCTYTNWKWEQRYIVTDKRRRLQTSLVLNSPRKIFFFFFLLKLKWLDALPPLTSALSHFLTKETQCLAS